MLLTCKASSLPDAGWPKPPMSAVGLGEFESSFMELAHLRHHMRVGPEWAHVTTMLVQMVLVLRTHSGSCNIF